MHQLSFLRSAAANVRTARAMSHLILVTLWFGITPLALTQSAPYANTQAAGPITASSATLNGMVVPNGAPTIVWFEWGTNSNFGKTTSPVDVGSGTTVVRHSSLAGGLETIPTYHFRIAASNSFGVVYGAEQIFSNGRHVFVWGQNYGGQTSLPHGLVNVVGIAGGSDHQLALKNDGTVMVWGSRFQGQTNIPVGLSNVVAVAARGYSSFAVKADGTVAGWGTGVTVPAGLSNVVAVATGGSHCLALQSNGLVLAWGNNNYGQTNVPPSLSNVVAVAAGWNVSLALKADGQIASWGIASQTNIPSGLSNVVAIAAGLISNNRVALKSDRTIVSLSGAAVPGGITNVVAIACGGGQVLALKRDGVIIAWGSSGYGENIIPPGLNRGIAVAAGDFHSSVLYYHSAKPFTHTQMAAPVTENTATLNGMVLPNGLPTVTWFEWGTNSSYGLRSEGTNIAAEYSVVRLNHKIANLTPRTAYYSRLVASNSLGVVYGAVQVFGTGHSLVGWGANNYGQLNFPSGLNDIISIAGGYRHSLASRADGSVLAWGDNSAGQTNVPPDITNAVAVAAGGFHSVALRSDGTVLAWGDNTLGQANVPTGLSNVIAISAGPNHSVALRTDGTITAWGYGLSATNSPQGLNNVVAIAGGNFNMALRADGRISVWGTSLAILTNVPAGLSNVIAISAGQGQHLGLALKSDGKVVAWGGQTNVPAGLSNLVAVAAGGQHGLALKAGGEVAAWGVPLNGRTNVPTWIPNITTIAAGNDHSLALSAGTKPYAFTQEAVSRGATNIVFAGMVVPNTETTQAWFEWGTDENLDQITPALDVGHGIGVVRLSEATEQFSPSATYHYRVVASNSFGVTYGARRLFATGQRVAAWGQNSSGQTDIPTGLVGVVGVAGNINHSLALKEDGTLVEWGGSPASPSLSNIVALAAARDLSLALTGDGNVIAWGENSQGQADVPAAATNGIAVATGGYHCLILRSDGTVAAWGWNVAGVSSLPVGLGNVVMVAVGEAHNLFLSTDGRVTGQGVSYTGANVPANLSNVVAVAAGAQHSMALQADGRVVAWGGNNFGQINTPPALSNVVAIGAGRFHSHAIRSDGSLVTWGDNAYGQTNVPITLTGITAIGGGGDHSLALAPNLLPHAASLSITGAMNQDLIVQMIASDANSDPLNYRIATLPGAGSLFQYTVTGRGTMITTSDTPVADNEGKVIFAPAPAASGWPYTKFTFSANDGQADSAPATIAINVIPLPIIEVSSSIIGGGRRVFVELHR